MLTEKARRMPPYISNVWKKEFVTFSFIGPVADQRKSNCKASLIFVKGTVTKPHMKLTSYEVNQQMIIFTVEKKLYNLLLIFYFCY